MVEFWSKALLMTNVEPYEPETILFDSSTPGTYELEIPTEIIAEVYVVAAGSGACVSAGGISAKGSRSGGGSGSAFIGVIKIPKGTISLTVGRGGPGGYKNGEWAYGSAGGNSSLGEIVVAFGATGSSADKNGAGAGGNGGATPSIAAQILATIQCAAGRSGEHKMGTAPASGGSSLYGGYGRGGNSNGTSPEAGTNGYIKIIYKGLRA